MDRLPILMDPVPEPETADDIYCARIGRDRPVCEHRACPYCFGTAAEIETGVRATYCSFEPGADPICFGFPESSTRLLRG